jgi:hypothetical protein
MSWSKNVSVPYHQQELGAYCGPAVAQMLLDALTGTLWPRQADLYKLVGGAPNGQYSTTPARLAGILNQAKAGYPGTFRVDARADIAASMALAIGSLLQLGTPVPLAVQSGSHWVLLCGIETDIDPSLGNPYSILNVWINDPWPVPPSTPPPPHSDPDGCGGVGANRSIPWGAWDSGNWFDAFSLNSIGPADYYMVVDARAPQLGQPAAVAGSTVPVQALAMPS